MTENTLQPEFISGMQKLFDELLPRITAGEVLQNRMFSRLADQAFGGSIARGTYSSRDAYDVLEAAVNRHVLNQIAARVSSEKAPDLFCELREMLKRLPTQTYRTQEQSAFQQFSTTPHVAMLVAKLASIKKQDVVLEPSAGNGSLAIWARAMGAEVICNEIAPRRRQLLQLLGFTTHNVDAELIDDLLPDEIKPNVIVANPPFSATGGRVIYNDARFGLRHIESALARLVDGGRLAAILGEAVSFRRPACTPWWEKIMESYTVRANFGVAEGEFSKYGTGVAFQVLVIDKIGKTAGANWQEKLNGIVWGEAKTVEEAWEQLEAVAAREENRDTTETHKRSSTSLFVPYVPAKIKGGFAHPAPIVESASMAAAMPPDISYHPHLPLEAVTEGRLSTIQFERVIYAGQRHEQRLPSGARAGFFVGDGTGVGKGRVLAAIILDNWFQNRRRAVWFSVNNDLMDATRRDLRDLGVSVPLASISEDTPDNPIRLSRGVLFSSYGSLIAKSKKGTTRLKQIIDWLGPDGIVIFDEAHKAKNALSSGQGEPTLTGKAVIELQDEKLRPDLRVIYSSATGATNVRNMAYMTRLGLWGPGTAFPRGFEAFMDAIDNGGVGAMEMVSRDMKSLGMYLSGSISYGTCPISGKAVEYHERVHRLTPEQRIIYNHASTAWKAVLQNVEKALKITEAGKRARAKALNRFWGDHQRFFRQIICSFKVPTVIEEIKEALTSDKAAVVSLVGTGEARTREQVAKMLAEGGSLEDLDFSPREILGNLIERGFPTEQYQTVSIPGTDRTMQVVVMKNGEVVHSKQALKMKQSLLDSVSALHLPENPLDQLVNFFGEFQVSEITGRRRRLIRDPQSGHVQYKKRAPEGVAMQRVNVYNMERFQNGETMVSIISDAGSIGISLHASNRAPNRRRRRHIAHEFGWSADKQLQCFGRTHRSDQAMPPEYVLVSTELAGEKRFSSTIARRLGSLGALTKGDRGAADNADWARYNFETQEGRSALALTYKQILQGEKVPGLSNPKQTLRDIGLLVKKDGGEEIRKEDEKNVPRFLNRILALGVEEQNALFDYFAQLFDQMVAYAKANGTFDEGVTDLDALSIRLAKEPRIVHTDSVTGAETILYPLEVERWSERMSFDHARGVCVANEGKFLRHAKSGNFILALNSGHHTNPENGETYATFSIWKPEGPRVDYLSAMDLTKSYVPVVSHEAENWWTDTYNRLPTIEKLEVHIIGGAILPIWDRLKSQQGKLRVVRVSTHDGHRIVGIEVPNKRLGGVLRAIGVSSTLSDPEDVFHAVLDTGDYVPLVNNMQLKLSQLAGMPAIELECNKSEHYDELRRLGLINESIRHKQRFFVPTDETKGIALIAAVLKRYPMVSESQVQADSLPVKDTSLARERIITLEEWIIPPKVVDEFADLPILSVAAATTISTVADDSYAMQPQAAMNEVNIPIPAILSAEQGRLFD